MDYDEFKQFVGEDMDVPELTPKWHELIEGPDTLHLRICLGYVLSNGTNTPKDIISGGEKIVESLKALQERGAERGKDYIMTVHGVQESGFLFFTLHTLNSFLSPEDFDE